MNRAKRSTCWLFAGTVLRTPCWHSFRKLRDFCNSRGYFKVFFPSRRSSLLLYSLFIHVYKKPQRMDLWYLLNWAFHDMLLLLKIAQEDVKVICHDPFEEDAFFHSTRVNTWRYTVPSSTSISGPGLNGKPSTLHAKDSRLQSIPSSASRNWEWSFSTNNLEELLPMPGRLMHGLNGLMVYFSIGYFLTRRDHDCIIQHILCIFG